MASAVRSSGGDRHKVFADTSYFFALLNPRDPHHAEAIEISEQIAGEGSSVYTTWEVVVETVALLRYRAGFQAARIFLQEVAPDLILVHPLEAERRAAIQAFLRRGRDQKLSLCDAISYVIVSTRLSWSPCLTFDADFAALGFTIMRH